MSTKNVSIKAEQAGPGGKGNAKGHNSITQESFSGLRRVSQSLSKLGESFKVPRRSTTSFLKRMEEIDDEDHRPYLEHRYLNGPYYEEAMAMFSTYDPEAWLPTLNLRMTPFIFYPWITLTAFITFLTAFVEYHREYLGEFSLSTDAHIIMGGALSFLVVFRTNSSYDRWWEARCSWQTVISTCRTL
eukprot:4325633-Prymnesium_polylepis.3